MLYSDIQYRFYCFIRELFLSYMNSRNILIIYVTKNISIKHILFMIFATYFMEDNLISLESTTFHIKVM